MSTISLEQLQKLFTDLRAETPWDVDGEMLWGYFFVSPDEDKLVEAGNLLAQRGYEVAGVYENEDEPGYILHVYKVEAHTPETLYARNEELEAFAEEAGLEAYDGMDVSPTESLSEEFDLSEADLESLDGAFESDSGLPTHEREVVNPDLVAAIESLDESTEAQLRLAEELNKATYLIPVYNTPVDEEGNISDDEPIKLLICANEENEEYIPLFTDLEQMQAWTDEPVSAMIFSADETWDFIVSQEDCLGGVINPANTSVEVTREQAALFLDRGEDEEEEEE